mgnify:CR=1 FL=1
MPMAVWPLFRAAARVVPEPANGSRMRDPGGKIPSRCSIKGIGLAVRWSLSLENMGVRTQPAGQVLTVLLYLPFVAVKMYSH